MRHLTKEQVRAPRRDTESISLPEFSAPLLLAKPSASLVMSLRERKVDFASTAALTAMLADMAVDEDGARLFSPEEVPAFLEGISADSLNALMTKCFEMQAPRKAGDSGNSRPSTSAA
jgi:Fe-S cluster assembly iron-binding protein IscA